MALALILIALAAVLFAGCGYVLTRPSNDWQPTFGEPVAKEGEASMWDVCTGSNGRAQAVLTVFALSPRIV